MPQVVRRVYAAKGREFAKPMGLVGGWAAHETLHVLDAGKQAMVRAITLEHESILKTCACCVMACVATLLSKCCGRGMA